MEGLIRRTLQAMRSSVHDGRTVGPADVRAQHKDARQLRGSFNRAQVNRGRTAGASLVPLAVMANDSRRPACRGMAWQTQS